MSGLRVLDPTKEQTRRRGRRSPVHSIKHLLETHLQPPLVSNCRPFACPVHLWCINVAALRLYAIILIITRCGRRKGNSQGRRNINHSCLRGTNTTAESPSCSVTLCLTDVHNILSLPYIHVFICIGVSAYLFGQARG